MDKTQLVKLLQEILEFEYTDIFLYNNEAELLLKRIKDSEKLYKLYKNFALDELAHADIISRKMLDLGGKPIWQYKMLEYSDSVRQSLKSHIERETKAIQLYSKLINEIEDRSFKVILKGIRQNEEEHLQKIVDFLQKLKK